MTIIGIPLDHQSFGNLTDYLIKFSKKHYFLLSYHGSQRTLQKVKHVAQ
jgi:hypothetical protein